MHCQVVEAPRLVSWFIANEDRQSATIVELYGVRLHHLHIRHAHKCAQEGHIWTAPILGLVWRHAINGSGGRPVQQKDYDGDGLTLEHCPAMLRLFNKLRHRDDDLIPSLDESILLRGVRRRVLSLDIVLHTVLLKLN